MEFKKLLNKNISFLFVLPLLKDHFSIKIGNSKYHGITYMLDSGLLNTYLLKNKIYNNSLFLEFNTEFLLQYAFKTKDNIDKNLLDIITNLDIFLGIENIKNKTIIELKIDPYWKEDIHHIINSNYSKLSEKYKENLLNKGSFILSKNNSFNHYTVIKNIAVKISNKDQSVIDLINNYFKTNVDFSDSELYTQFNTNNEDICQIA